MDKKRGFSRKKADMDKMEDLVKKVDDLTSIREHDDIENMPDKIFDNVDNIDGDQFNTMFESMYKNQTDLIPHTGNPLAYNADNTFESFGSVKDYEILYNEDDDVGNSLFGSVKMSGQMSRKVGSNKSTKITKTDMEKHQKESSYYKHNDKTTGKSVSDRLKEMELERDSETKHFENKTFQDYDDDPTCGGYGITHELFDVNVDDEHVSLNAKYQRLLESEINKIVNHDKQFMF